MSGRGRKVVPVNGGKLATVDAARELHKAGLWHGCHWDAARDGSGWTCEVCGRWVNMPGFRRG